MILVILNNFSEFVSTRSKTESVYICICVQFVVRTYKMISSTNKHVHFSVYTASLHVDEITAFEIKAYNVFCEKKMNKRSCKKQ
jgi:hypothetical protein